MFEQIKLSDHFLHYDDVQLPQGRSFVPRVQIKTSGGNLWLTAPLDRKNSGKLIKDILFSSDVDWRDKHLKTIRNAYSRAPYFEEMLELVSAIYDYPTNFLSEFNIHAIQSISRWLGITTEFGRSSETDIAGSSSQRLVDLCNAKQCKTYVTGLGALKYLDHGLFEQRSISVYYMNYQKIAYPQIHGEFSPYVSIIDAIANCGGEARHLLCSEAVFWKEFTAKIRDE